MAADKLTTYNTSQPASAYINHIIPGATYALQEAVQPESANIRRMYERHHLHPTTFAADRVSLRQPCIGIEFPTPYKRKHKKSQRRPAVIKQGTAYKLQEARQRC